MIKAGTSGAGISGHLLESIQALTSKRVIFTSERGTQHPWYTIFVTNIATSAPESRVLQVLHETPITTTKNDCLSSIRTHLCVRAHLGPRLPQ